MPGYEASGWGGIGAPQNTPTEVIDKLNREINAALADPKITAEPAALGRPARDMATTRRGGVGYALARRVPRRLLDRAVSQRLARMALRGGLDGGGLAAEMVARLSTPKPRRPRTRGA